MVIRINRQPGRRTTHQHTRPLKPLLATGMARLTQRLPVSLIPEQRVITTVRFYMVNRKRRNH
jgi:hypothetical protein